MRCGSRSSRRSVGEAFLQRLLDECDHVVNVVGGADELFGHFEIERSHVFEKCFDVFFSVFAESEFRSGGIGDDAIVNIGKFITCRTR